MQSLDTASLRKTFQEAVVKCSERCLYQSAKWAAEFLTSMPPPNKTSEPGSPLALEVQAELTSTITSRNSNPEEAQLEADEINLYLLAKSFFDCREFDRCSAVFLPDNVLQGILATSTGRNNQTKEDNNEKGKASCWSSESGPFNPRLSQKSLFLALYAKFMSGEKRKDEESEMVMGPYDGGQTVNKQLITICQFLKEWFGERVDEDGNLPRSEGWLEFLYGMVLSKNRNEEEAMRWLIKSVHICSINWACWLEITLLISRMDDLNRISDLLPQNIFFYIFFIHTSLELYQESPSLSNSLGQLARIFPQSPFILTSLGIMAYHSKDFVTAEAHFGNLLTLHPYRLDYLDQYSNILYVMNCRPKLSFLAHLCSNVDKFRPESCVVIGNYYSLISSHEKSVQYFRRALTLDRSFLSAWTLMGHEYVELKNTHAAIESYRRAVDINRRDYRAWYGLGQTYEVLEMHAYALWYYKRASGLRPWDGKMWQAVGQCLKLMGRDLESIKALKRALVADSHYEKWNNKDRSGILDPEILLEIANAYERLEDDDEARSYMEMCLAQEEGGLETVEASVINIHTPESQTSDDESRLAPENYCYGTGVTAATSKARMWLAKYAMRTGDYEKALQLGTELCQDGIEIEEAKALVKETRMRRMVAIGGVDIET
ncbi:Anaphase-promoting complex subunit 8 [Golovinomyces cichoracearum]|uniref:Anaphase-promoting complex subunit 8 n=1 Tax=Golovinomyces cichoracearum TaxID=62708 RepID=A0A420IVJ3_9PEZI|nr:Anaphase-promoting complex subunit 8 [Golovinomyces cichoracearum]